MNDMYERQEKQYKEALIVTKNDFVTKTHHKLCIDWAEDNLTSCVKSAQPGEKMLCLNHYKGRMFTCSGIPKDMDNLYHRQYNPVMDY